MFIFCFIAESSLVKECSEVSGMEHVGGPVVFPHLAVNFKQKMKENTLMFVITPICTKTMTCKYCFYHSVIKYLIYSLLAQAPSVRLCAS